MWCRSQGDPLRQQLETINRSFATMLRVALSGSSDRDLVNAFTPGAIAAAANRQTPATVMEGRSSWWSNYNNYGWQWQWSGGGGGGGGGGDGNSDGVGGNHPDWFNDVDDTVSQTHSDGWAGWWSDGNNSGAAGVPWRSGHGVTQSEPAHLIFGSLPQPTITAQPPADDLPPAAKAGPPEAPPPVVTADLPPVAVEAPTPVTTTDLPLAAASPAAGTETPQAPQVLPPNAFFRGANRRGRNVDVERRWPTPTRIRR